jgi:glucose/mannose transport system permease protein
MARTEKIVPFLFVLPSIILVGIFVYGAIGWNFVISLTAWDGLTPNYDFVGLDNYARLFRDEIFINALKNNIILIIFLILGVTLVGLILATLLDQNVKGENCFRTVYLFPMAITFVVTATIWVWMYDPTGGVLNSILDALHLGSLKSGWRTDPDIALYCIILALIWQFSGYTMVVFLSGIRSVPVETVEAAKVDGAGPLQSYSKIIIPQLTPSILSIFTVMMIYALKAFDFIWVAGKGGPAGSTEILAILMYKTAFSDNHFAYSAAIATILFLMAIAIVLPYLWITRKKI